MAETDETSNVPTGNQDTDFDKVTSFVKDLVNQYAADAIKTAQQPVVNQADQQRQLLRDTLQPVIGQDIANANFAAADAKDYVSFYTGDPLAMEYRDEVEAAFNQAKENGHPLPRSEVLRWVIGKERLTDQKKFNERETVRQKAQLDRAERGVDTGAGSLNRAKDDPTFANFDKLSLEDMEKALEGIVF